MTHSTHCSRWGWLITLLSLSFGIIYAQQSTTPQRVTVAFYNLENLFDTIDQENNDEEFLPEGANRWTLERYQHKLRNMSHVISLIGGDGPAIIGVAEIENRGVLEDLIAEEQCVYTLTEAGYIKSITTLLTVEV